MKLLPKSGNFEIAKWFYTQVFVDYYRIDNYTYFDNAAKPQQSSSSLNISQIGGEATTDLARFHINGRVLFQKALTNGDLLPMPDFIGRVNFITRHRRLKKLGHPGGYKIVLFYQICFQRVFTDT
jgi:hypothetical protein